MAISVGTVLTFTKRFESLSIVLPFLVPFLVGLFTRVTARLGSRHRDTLVKLPALRRDPAFIIDGDGAIVAAAGNTQRLFETLGVSHIDQFLSPSDGRRAIEEVRSRCSDNRERDTARPVFSPIAGVWYQLQINRESDNDILIWLTDVSAQVQLEERKGALREFTRRLQQELQDGGFGRDDDRRLAGLLLSEGYEVVMLARITNAGDTGRGTLYHADGRQPAQVEFSTDSDAPIVRSRKEGRAIWDTVEHFVSEQRFHEAYPILPEVGEFVGTPIRNLANYHSGDVSIIAFNKRGTLTAADIGVLESVADTAVTAFSLLDLAHRADLRFIQSIHGVCAAAEYSDELTGKHIWRVNDYSRILAAALGLPGDQVDTIGVVAAMHDIGKVAIPHIIKLPRALTEEERREMQMHTVYGAQTIDRMRRATTEPDPRLDTAYQIALHHHQRWNGTGYPGLIDDRGEFVDPVLRGAANYRSLRAPASDDIPLAARIVSLADTYDALRSARQYKPALSHEDAVALMCEDDRTGHTGPEMFGPALFETFMDQRDRLATVFDANHGEPDRRWSSQG